MPMPLLGPHGKKALFFDGNSYVQIPNSPSLNPSTTITIELLVYVARGDWQTMFRKEGVYLLELGGANWGGYGRRLQFGVWGEGAFRNIVESDVDMPLQFVHVIAIYDGIDGYLYLNSSLHKKDNTSNYKGVINLSASALHIGNHSREKFGGTIAVARLYNRPLSDSEVYRNYLHALNLRATDIRNGLVLEFIPNSLDCDNNVWRDNSGYGNNGIIHGAKCIHI